MAVLQIEPLSRRTGKLELLAFLADQGGLDRRQIGRIELQAGRASVEVPDDWHERLVRKLDGQRLGERRVRVSSTGNSATPRGAEDHFDRLGRLLGLESQAEAQAAAERGRRLSAAEAERLGTSLVRLAVIDEDVGLGGRSLLTLGKQARGALPWTRLDVGSPVVLSPESARRPTGTRGVIEERQELSVRVACDSAPDDLSDYETWRIDLSSDEVTAQRQRAALARAQSARGDRLAELRDVLLGQREPEFAVERADAAIDPGLNSVQLDAVRFALTARDVALIHGPPGTGKTRTVVEAICRAVARGEKVLACAPSNMAVDNLFERLLGGGQRAVRLGHPARVMPELRAHTLDLLVDEHPDVRLARKLVKEARQLFRKADRHTRAKPAPGARQEARQEARNLLADARRLEAQAVDHILDTADVLCATTTSLDSKLLGDRRFDLAVIDEACQSTEPGCWLPLLRANRVILAGDHCQLPPTVVSRAAADEGFGVSIFERLMGLWGPQIARRLSLQYRMNRAIMEFSSAEFYDGELQADAAVGEHRLCDLPGVQAAPLSEIPAEFLDTAGAGFDEQIEPGGESRLNPSEASLVCRKVRTLLDLGVCADQIAVIAPYAAQVRTLRDRLSVAGLEIDSVDGFQGREKEAVIISLVRSNPRGEIGFLSDVRRMNVALTRARRKLLVIGDSATLGNDPFYCRMIEYFERLGAYHTVWEEGGFDE